MDFRGLDSIIILILIKGRNSHVHREFPESLHQALLVGIMSVGRLGVGVSEAEAGMAVAAAAVVAGGDGNDGSDTAKPQTKKLEIRSLSQTVS